MKQETQTALCREIFALIDNKATSRAAEITLHPVAAYNSPERLLQEQELLFRKYPLFAAFSSQIPEEGDYLAQDGTGIPILLIRAKDREVNAFINVCRHRGTRLASGCGRMKGAMSCPYHAWRYDFDGDLKSIPDEDSFTSVDKSERGLIRLPVVEKYGMIWVRATAGEDFDIDEILGGLAPELENYHFEKYHCYASRTLRHKMNWKMMIDTFLEPYHFAPLHKNTVAPIFFPNMCLFHPFGPNLRETLPRRSIVEERTRPEGAWNVIKHSALVYALFPNTVLVMQIDHVELWRSYPANNNADECVIYLDFLIPDPAETKSARDHWERNLDLTVRTVLEEDFPIVESVQAGLNSGAQAHLIIGRNEPALAHYQRSIAKSLGLSA